MSVERVHDISQMANDILAKCDSESKGLLVGITDATVNVVQFKFRGKQNNHNPVFLPHHVHSYTNVVCLKLYDDLLSKGLEEYGPIYLGAEVPGNLRTLFVIKRNIDK